MVTEGGIEISHKSQTLLKINFFIGILQVL